MEEWSHLAGIAEVNSVARNRNEISWFYSFLWISMLPFQKGFNDVFTALKAVECVERAAKATLFTAPLSCAAPVFKPIQTQK